MRLSLAALHFSVVVVACSHAPALWAQSASQMVPTQTNPPAPVRPGQKQLLAPPKDAGTKDSPAKETPAPAKCSRFETGRNAIYAAVIKTVLPELPDKTKAGDTAGFQGELEQIYQKYEGEAKAGDVQALRKMMAIEMFVAQIRRKDSGDLTLRKACALGKLPAKQRGIADALSCAVLSLEGERREDETSRDRAKTMMANAKAVIPESANAATPGKILFDDVTRGLEGCY